MDYTKKDIKRHIEKYAKLTAEAAELAKKIEDEKAYFSQLAERDLADSKVKTKCYYGDTAKITAVTASTVKINRAESLNKLFGDRYRDYVKEELKTDIRDAATKRMLAAVFYGEYIDETAENCIKQMTQDSKQHKLLMKKLKGANPQKDAENIRAITGCGEDDAAYYASVFAEVKAHEEFEKMMKLTETDAEKAEELIHQALTVERTAKVGIELFEK